jgi:hypothetical protein
MIQLSISLLLANLMLISPVLPLNDKPHFNQVEQPAITPKVNDHKVKTVKKASYLELLLTKTLVTFSSQVYSVKQTMANDQHLKMYTELLPHDKPFLVVKKFQSNYLS